MKITINGKTIDLPEGLTAKIKEIIEAAEAEEKQSKMEKSPFERAGYGETYYRLTSRKPLTEYEAMNLSLTDLYVRLKAYEDTGLTPEQIHAIDAVPVVRCGQCVYFEPFRPHDGFCKISTMLNNNDFFCKYGQRREDGDGDG